MAEKQSTRRRFLKFLGLSAGATLAAPVAMAAFIDHEEIKKLNPEQQEFMIRYGKWMDEFSEVNKIKKSTPYDVDNNKKIMALSEKAETFKPELDVFLKDSTFAFIFKESLKRVSVEIV